MILRALYDYYQNHRNELPSRGKELVEIGFIILLSDKGEFLRFEDRRSAEKKGHADSFLVRKGVSRSSAPVANWLYDNAAYVLGYDEKKDASKYYATFTEKINSVLSKNPQNKDLQILCNFFSQSPEQKLLQMQADPLWEDIIKNLSKKFSRFSFRIEGEDEIIAEKEELIALDIEESNESTISDTKVCLITGEPDEITDITTATMIPGSQATAKLVAFQVNSGYDSYGKKKGENAPIGKKAEFAYTTALNKMLSQDSKNKFLFGNRTFLFWSSFTPETASTAKELEMVTFDLFSQDSKNPEKDPENVKNIFKSIYSGKKPTGKDDKFYILGLSPNAARIAVSYWAEIPLNEFAGNILQHFEDFSIADTRKDKKPYMGIRSILSAITMGGKAGDCIPNLPEAIAKSIFQNLPYPSALYAAAIRRIRAEQQVGITRAAIIKAYLNRLRSNIIKITPMLNTTCNHPSYVYGRLFAVMEKIQHDANGKSNVRERYFNSAMSTPAVVFPTLVNLSIHHLAKLNKSKNVYYSELLSQIYDLLETVEFPTQLSSTDQGSFVIGYFQQVADLYTPKADKAEEVEK